VDVEKNTSNQARVAEGAELDLPWLCHWAMLPFMVLSWQDRDSCGYSWKVVPAAGAF